MAKVSLKEVLAAHPNCGDGKSFKQLIDNCSVKPATNPNRLTSWEGVVHKPKFLICGRGGNIVKIEL